MPTYDKFKAFQGLPDDEKRRLMKSKGVVADRFDMPVLDMSSSGNYLRCVTKTFYSIFR